MQAAILRVKLKYVDDDNRKRNKIAERYLDGLRGLPLELPIKRDGCDHVYHLFVIKTNDREALQDFLGENGVRTSIQYPVPIHEQVYYMSLGRNRSLPVTEKLAKEIVSLPMYAELSLGEVKTVINSVKSFYDG